ncbi:tyrosine-type recombinase/integrase [Candidatus Enterococcus ferrettii]|uniref:Site-specific integrase n=1 Tax=Candidatus Enterococcus ferrettii TaxID=2815324 RepID=A0ABV0EQ92_9ENTE|nr:site-specific integrase [Enterococcus sp. 665A]MBO1341001.1 tyrosine-type recombinase/integrase [Enterococcus sp. 665A]
MRRGENIYRRKDKRWEGRYPIGKKANGKTKYASVYGKTLKAVREKLYPLKLKYQLIQEVQGNSAISFQEWGDIWLNETNVGVKQSTYANYKHKLNYYVLSEIGQYGLNELNEELAENLLQSLKDRKLKASTIQSIFRIVNQCLNLAIRKKLIKENPFTSVKLPKVIKENNQSLTLQEQHQLEKAAVTEKDGNGLPILLALHAGLRIGEISALSWKDIDFQNNLIHIKATYQRTLSVLGECKTTLIYTDSKTQSATRTIPMSDTIKQILLQQKAQSSSAFVASNKQKPIEPRLLTYRFHRMRMKAGLDKIHFHQLRHTFATRCLESNGDVVSVSALMGHSSTQMTLDTYASSLIEQRIQVIAKMEKRIS